ncbi:hypothetical protein D920_02048 [Enterococcus faecalis 13-SD-W-01]|nr:hypothetical protein D920_02048 [Enterococcus faecalis 13-SD-W-01]
MLTYTIPHFAKEVRTTKENIYLLVDAGFLKTMSFGSRDKKITIYEAERFLREHSGTNFDSIIKEAKKRKELSKLNEEAKKAI